MELRQYVTILWKRWWLVALTTLVAAVTALVVSLTATPMYRSTVTLEVIRGGDPSQDPYLAARATETTAGTYVQQVTASAVMDQVSARLGLGLTARQISAYISASQITDSGMVQISAEHPNPELAKALAETTAQVFIEQKQAQQQARYGASLTELEAQIAELEAEIMATRGAIATLGNEETLAPAARVELARLQTLLTNDQTRLTVMLQSTEQFRLAMVRYTDYLSVFSPAELPRAPFSPQPLRNTALALVVGVMIGVGVAFLLDYLDDTVHTPEDAREALGINVLGAVPDVADEEAIGWFAQAQPLSPTAESFRNLRTGLQYVSLDTPLRTLLVTSTEPDEGKTFIASNLATVFALTGKKVLLLEADLRRPTVHRRWHEKRAPGLIEALKAFSDALMEDTSEGSSPVEGHDDPLDEVAAFIRPTRVEGLALLAAGSEVATPSELLNSQTFRRMVEALLSRYDLLVIDTPPILAASDATILANHVDGIVMVAVSGKSRLPSIARAVERVQSVGGNLLGLVINRLTARSGGYYYRYYEYHSDYAYGQDGAHSRDRQRSHTRAHGRGSDRAYGHDERVDALRHQILEGEHRA